MSVGVDGVALVDLDLLLGQTARQLAQIVTGNSHDRPARARQLDWKVVLLDRVGVRIWSDFRR
ncbi:hypothetical protein ACIRRA_35640 [Nocardia sp. NPDC101769]|uniref:hypothetical protein n=1 Tax=Nocardia sp. NPDC101769 TaxID=3364333 RepID=UPI0037F9466B